MKKNIIKGRWYQINKKIKKKLTAKYHTIRDWRMDPRGYFLIAVDSKKNFIKVGYCKISKLRNISCLICQFLTQFLMPILV